MYVLELGMQHSVFRNRDLLIKKHVLHLESSILTCASISYLAVAAEEADDKVLLVPSFGSSCHVIFVCY